jgi:hypothetical protein
MYVFLKFTVIHNVAYRPIAGRDLDANNGTGTVSVQRRGKNASTSELLLGKHVAPATGETGCFLRGPRWGV